MNIKNGGRKEALGKNVKKNQHLFILKNLLKLLKWLKLLRERQTQKRPHLPIYR